MHIWNVKNGTTFNSFPSSKTLNIRQTYSYTYWLIVPPFTNSRLSLTASCMDRITGRIPCTILSLQLVSMGRNIDGLWSEYSYGLMSPTYYRNSTLDNYYNDTAFIDLGIVTNTGMGFKLLYFLLLDSKLLTVSF